MSATPAARLPLPGAAAAVRPPIASGGADGPPQDVAELARLQRLRRNLVGAGLLIAAVLLVPLVGTLVVAGRGFYAVGVAALLLPVLFWRVRPSPVIMLALAATAVPRFADPAGDDPAARIPLFRSFSETFGVSGGFMLPIELVIGLALLLWLAHAITNRRLSIRASHTGVAMAVLMGIALAAEGYGLARGGVFHISLWELRPFLYLGLSYLLASQLLTTRGALRGVLWAMVIGTGTISIVGTERTFTLTGTYPRPDAILEHDEAFFFGCFILLTVALWVYGQRGWLRRLATGFLPLVVIADFGNNRRAAWIIIPATLLALVVVAYARMPERRRRILVVVGVALALATGYTVAFHSTTSIYGAPAHGIWSQFNPDSRDYLSNLYRDLENANLGLDIRSAPLGEGFGVPIPHPIPLLDATSIDPLIDFIPHNNILYVWLRLGTQGAIAFWFVVGAAVVAACRLARQPEPLYGLFGTVALCAIIAWLAEGWLDKGIVSFRITILVGCLIGGVAAARRLAAAARQEDEAQRGPMPPRTVVVSRGSPT